MDCSDCYCPSEAEDRSRLNVKNNIHGSVTSARSGSGGARGKRAQAHWPEKATFKARVMTFVSKWPNHIKATSVQLANAGLFYLGDGDRVMCFQCGGGLKDWDKNDDPWFEHCKWYPHCEFMLNEKGSEYIKQVTDKSPQLHRPSSSQASDTVTQVQTSFDVPPPIHRVNLEEKLKEAKQSELYEEALMFGFDPESVETVVKRYINVNHEMYTSLAKLVGDIQNFEATREQEVASDDTSNFTSQLPQDLQDVGNIRNQPAGQVLMSAAFPGKEETVIKPPTPVAPTAVSSNKHCDDVDEDETCKVCLDNKCDCVLMPCGHVCCCVKCASALRQCPICRARMESIVKFYR